MPGAWEKAVNGVLPADRPVRDRDDLTRMNWVTDTITKVITPPNYTGADTVNAQEWDARKLGVVPATYQWFGNTQYGLAIVFIGAKVDFGQLDASTGTFAQLLGVREDLAFLQQGGNNGSTHLPSFDNTAGMLTGVRNTLAQKSQEVRGWAKQVGSGEQFDGQTAKQMQLILENLGLRLDEFGRKIADPTMLGQLANSKNQLNQAIQDYSNKFNAWYNSPLAAPVRAVQAALDKYDISGLVTNGKPTLANVMGDLTMGGPTGGFTKNLDAEAKSLWMDNYAVMLDRGTDQVFQGTQNALTNAASTTPASPQLGQIDANGAGGGNDPSQQMKDELEKQQKQMQEQQKQQQEQMQQQQKQQQEEMQKQQEEQQKQQEEQQKQQQEQQQKQQEEMQKQQEEQQQQQEEAQQKQQEAQDKAQQQMEDQQQDPPDVPDVDQDDPTGQNKDLGGDLQDQLNKQNDTPPPPPPPPNMNPQWGNSQLSPDMLNKLNGGPGGGSQIIGPDGKPATYPNGTPISAPPGSKINPDGTVTKPDGSMLLDQNGNPVKVDPASSLQSPDANNFGPYLPRPFLPHLPDSAYNAFNKAGLVPPDADGNNLRKPPGSPDIQDPMKRSTVNSSALDDNLRKPVNPATEGGPRGKGGAGNQTPMMPPPPMGGSGMGQDKERNRSTWLSEEEETWNPGGGFSTAIGR